MQKSSDAIKFSPSLKALKAFLQFGLILSAAFVLFFHPRLTTFIQEGTLSENWLMAGPTIFLVFFLCFIAVKFALERNTKKTVADVLPLGFGIILIAILFPYSFREYRDNRQLNPAQDFFKNFSSNKDGRLRALAILASPRNNFNPNALRSLIHDGLLDRDPLVQQAARLVIEDNLGIRLKNGVEGIHQAQEIIRESPPSALLMKKGLP